MWDSRSRPSVRQINGNGEEGEEGGQGQPRCRSFGSAIAIALVGGRCAALVGVVGRWSLRTLLVAVAAVLDAVAWERKTRRPPLPFAAPPAAHHAEA